MSGGKTKKKKSEQNIHISEQGRLEERAKREHHNAIKRMLRAGLASITHKVSLQIQSAY